jgi:hypothetical protein
MAVKQALTSSREPDHEGIADSGPVMTAAWSRDHHSTIRVARL